MAGIFRARLRAARGMERLTLWFDVVQEVIVNAPAAHWDMLKQDLRYTLRTLNRARGFALTAILVTALGVGANTAAFSVADFVLFRSLPFPDPDTLVRLCEGPRTRRRVGLQQPAVAPELSRLQGDEHVVRRHGRVRGRSGEPGGRGRAAASRNRAGDAGSVSPAGREPCAGPRVRARQRRCQFRRDQPRPVAIAVRRRFLSARPDDQSQWRASHDHRRHAADVLLSHPRQTAVDAVDVQRAGPLEPHEQLHRGGGPPQAGRHVRAGPGGARVAGRSAGARLTRRPTRRRASVSTACATTCRRASA